MPTTTAKLNAIQWMEHHLAQIKATEEGSWDRFEAISDLAAEIWDREEAAERAAHEQYYADCAHEDANSGDEERQQMAREYYGGENPYEAPKRNPYAREVAA